VAEYDSVIPAGGSGTLTAKMQTMPMKNGRISKSINVVTDAADARNISLRFTIDVETPIVVRPAFRFNFSTIEGEEGRTRVLLHRSDGNPLEILGVETGDLELAAHVEMVAWSGSQKDPDAVSGDAWIELVSNPAADVGRRSGSVRIATNHPDLPELVMPSSWQVRPLIEARPEIVRLWLPTEFRRVARSTLFSLRHAGGKTFTVIGLEVSHPEIFTAKANSTAAATRQAIRVSLLDDVTPDTLGSTFEGWVKIETDDPERPTIEVPVIVSPKRVPYRR
jgi:hypothetical protein